MPEGHAFYSRRVGRAPQVSASTPSGGFSDVPGTATILGALKLSGKTSGGTSLGLIASLTDQADATTLSGAGTRASQAVEPKTQYLVGRLSKDLRQGRSGFGALVTATNRDVGDPSFSRLRSSALTGGFDAFHRFGGDRFEIKSWAFASQVRGSREALIATQRASPTTSSARTQTATTWILRGHHWSVRLASSFCPEFAGAGSPGRLAAGSAAPDSR